MAVYPAGHPGVSPVDVSTAVGQMRMLTGDYTGTPYVPDEPGYADYASFSDAELQALLDTSADSVPRAVGYAYLKLAGVAASEAVDWKSDDQAVTLSKRAAELRAIAALWFDRAASDDAGADIFEIFDTNGGGDWIPEAMIPEWGRQYIYAPYNRYEV